MIHWVRRAILINHKLVWINNLIKDWFLVKRINYLHLFYIGKIGLFYLIFYGVLAALVAICFWGFFQTLDPRIPRWQLERSIIGTNPGKLH